MTHKNKSQMPDHRGPGVRSSGAPFVAIPAIISLIFLALIAPFFYALYPLMIVNADATGFDWLNRLLAIGVVWIIVFLGGLLYPSLKGKRFAMILIRLTSIISLVLYALAIGADIAGYLASPTDRHIAVVAFWFPLIELAPAAWFLFMGLRRVAWFDPSAPAEQIGPSANTRTGFETQAGLNSVGQMPASLAAQISSGPAPPPCLLCYTAPPIAFWTMRRWWLMSLSLVLCTAAIALVIVIPVRSIIVYGLMGAMANYFRSLTQIRFDTARAHTGKQKQQS